MRTGRANTTLLTGACGSDVPKQCEANPLLTDFHFMPRRYVFCILLLTILVAGCGTSRSRAVSVVYEVGVSKLRGELQALLASSQGCSRSLVDRLSSGNNSRAVASAAAFSGTPWMLCFRVSES